MAYRFREGRDRRIISSSRATRETGSRVCARPSARILPREGRRRIFDLESRWKSTFLDVRPHGNWEHDRVS